MFFICSCRFSRLVETTSSVCEAVYAKLTNDASTATNHLMRQRIQIAMQGEPSIMVDLRHLNTGWPGHTFDTFWDNLSLVVNEVSKYGGIKIQMYNIYNVLF